MAERAAIVTGASSGIGLAIAQMLGEQGYGLTVAARRPEKLEAAAKTLTNQGFDVLSIPADLGEEEAIAGVVKSHEERFGRLDVLVNNAGVLVYDNVLDVDPDTADRFWTINALGPWLLAAAAVPLMRRNGWGRVVNVSTEMASLTRMTVSAPSYRVSKAALNAVTRLLAAELEGSGILVNALSPGWVRSEMGGPDAPRSIEQGCASILWGVDLPDAGPNGGFFQDGAALPW